MNKLIDLDAIGARKHIVVVANSKQLNQIKALLPELTSQPSRIQEVSPNVYDLAIDPIQVKVPKLIVAPRMKDIAEKEEASDHVLDFKTSAKFYKEAESKKGFKILSDDFSLVRNIKLFEGFSVIEKRWRRLITEKLGVDSVVFAEKPQNYKNKLPDHQVSQYSLSEFFESFLFSPASEDYIKAEWQREEKKDINAVLRMRKLTKIDELNFTLTREELIQLQRTRNACMHFRVITIKEYSDSVRIINDYIKTEDRRAFMKSITELLKPSNEALQNAFKLVQSMPKITLPKYDFSDYYNSILRSLL